MIEEYKTESEEAMIITTEETKEDGIKYLNINVSNSEVERNPDIVRLCANVGIEEYVKPKTGHWVRQTDDYYDYYECEYCGIGVGLDDIKNYCPNCGCRMIEPQESEDKE